MFWVKKKRIALPFLAGLHMIDARPSRPAPFSVSSQFCNLVGWVRMEESRALFLGGHLKHW